MGGYSAPGPASPSPLRRELWYYQLEGLLPPPPTFPRHNGGRPAATIDGTDAWVECYDAGPLHFGVWQSDGGWLERRHTISLCPMTPCPTMEIALCHVDANGGYIAERLALFLSPHPTVGTDTHDERVFSELPDLGSVVGRASELRWDPDERTLTIVASPLPPVVVARLAADTVRHPLHLILSLAPREAELVWEV